MYFPKFFHILIYKFYFDSIIILKNSNSENFLNTPYFALAENPLLTFSPRLYANDNLIKTEYRQAVYFQL